MKPTPHGVEIERKFAVISDGWRSSAGPPERLEQAYLSTSGPSSNEVRVRRSTAPTGAQHDVMTVKGTGALSRSETEFVVPPDVADALFLQAVGSIVKDRYRVEHAGRTWEVDCYQGALAGLVVAEVELESEQAAFETPDWAGEEVTFDPRYKNQILACSPSSPETADWSAHVLDLQDDRSGWLARSQDRCAWVWIKGLQELCARAPALSFRLLSEPAYHGLDGAKYLVEARRPSGAWVEVEYATPDLVAVVGSLSAANDLNAFLAQWLPALGQAVDVSCASDRFRPALAQEHQHDDPQGWSDLRRRLLSPVGLAQWEAEQLEGRTPGLGPRPGGRQRL